MPSSVPFWVLIVGWVASAILTIVIQLWIQKSKDRKREIEQTKRDLRALADTDTLKTIHHLVDGTATELRKRNDALQVYNEKLEMLLMRQATGMPSPSAPAADAVPHTP